MHFRFSMRAHNRWGFASYGAAAAAVLTCLLPAQSRAELMLYPTRVVIESSQRSAQVEIVNRGQTPETYRLNIVNRRMTESGSIVEIDNPLPDERFADQMLRYTPRQVTLQPGASQTVRISIRKPADLSAGEYRSHLQFDRVPDVSAATDLEKSTEDNNGQVAIKLQTLIGVSIPVIVRHGQTHATATLDALTLEPAQNGGAPTLSFALKRDGNRSLYGDLTAIYTAPGKAPVELAKASGIAVYAPNVQRRARLPLKLPEGVVLKGGALQLRYSERPDAGGALLAEATLQLP